MQYWEAFKYLEEIILKISKNKRLKIQADKLFSPRSSTRHASQDIHKDIRQYIQEIWENKAYLYKTAENPGTAEER